MINVQNDQHLIYLYLILFFFIFDRINGVMVNILVLSVVGSLSGQTNDYNIGIDCFSASS
jgi:hypothetical protein